MRSQPRWRRPNLFLPVYFLASGFFTSGAGFSGVTGSEELAGGELPPRTACGELLFVCVPWIA